MSNAEGSIDETVSDKSEPEKSGSCTHPRVLKSSTDVGTSVSEKKSLFARLAQDSKKMAEEMKLRKAEGVSTDKNRKLRVKCVDSRFATQPVTTEEVKEAKRQSKTQEHEVDVDNGCKKFEAQEKEVKSSNIQKYDIPSTECSLTHVEKNKLEISREDRKSPSVLRKVLSLEEQSADVEKGNSKMETARVEECRSGTIAERLAALQKSGECDWKKRISRIASDNGNTPSLNGIGGLQEALRKELTNTLGNRTSATEVEQRKEQSLAERLGKLENATHGWKKRVEPSDAVQFSVAGKMAGSLPSLPPLLPSPIADRKKKPCPARFKSKNCEIQKSEVSSSPASPEKLPSSNISYNRSSSLPNGVNISDGDEEKAVTPTDNVVSVPQIFNSDFAKFFGTVTSSITERDQNTGFDLDSVKSDMSHLLTSQRRSTKAQRRHVASKNPLKALAARNIKQEYVDVKSDIVEKEMKRINVEKLSKKSNMAIEALAGLASKEDFTAVSLKKPASQLTSPMLPYKPLMLLHVKGRRHVQTRLVEPSWQCINNGDSYLLVATDEVYHWNGEYANIIEKSRAAEIAQHIVTTHDLGCSASRICTIDPKNKNSKEAKSFWKLLGAEENFDNIKDAGHPDEDELYESTMISTNMIYEALDEELVPLDKYWGAMPKIEMLDPNRVLVFDFGTEMYMWMGKNVDISRRKSSVALSKELWNRGYDYTECDICPLTVASYFGCRIKEDNNTVEETKENKKGTKRPSWCLFAKVTQHMETILFREKFLDWPDFTRVIRAKGKSDDADKEIDASIDVKPCDAESMLSQIPPEPDLQLEGSHLGRGVMYYEEELRRYYDVKTLDVCMWHVSEFDSIQFPRKSLGQFHSGDSYVIRWLYSVTFTGRELNGQPSRHCVVGRDRCAYFCWQGRDASMNEQGAAALLTIELDKEKGPQVRVSQGYEPPAFCNLFNGTMVIYNGRRDLAMSTGDIWRLYICRGELENEAYLLQVQCNTRQLRSRASLVLVNTETNEIYIWHGSKSSEITRKVCVSCVKKLQENPPDEFGLSPDLPIDITEVIEGEEPKEFFNGLNSNRRNLYVSLLNSAEDFNGTPKLFYLSSNMGTFEATPVFFPSYNPDFVTPYPFLQQDLYSVARQPALFLLDSGISLWLWQGWWPEREPSTSEENDFSSEMENCSKNTRGTAEVRWQADRRAAMRTALDYWNIKYSDAQPPKAYLVWAGLEPLEFTNLFPEWKDRDDIAEINIKDGRKSGEVLPVEHELARLTQSTYPLEQLLQRPLPDGVDPTSLELYLSPQSFRETMKMTKEEFFALPSWKQSNLKKSAGLF